MAVSISQREAQRLRKQVRSQANIISDLEWSARRYLEMREEFNAMLSMIEDLRAWHVKSLAEIDACVKVLRTELANRDGGK